MRIESTPIPGVRLIIPRTFGDSRGFFLETYRRDLFIDAGIPADFVQDNHSRSGRGILRGMHFQNPNPQGKLVSVTRGSVFDVVVDIRSGSPTFGQWYGAVLDDAEHHRLWVPPGLAHGFCVLSDVADFVYKCTDYYAPGSEGGFLWNDPDVGVDWPLEGEPLLSEKDRNAPRLRDIPVERLFPFSE